MQHPISEIPFAKEDMIGHLEEFYHLYQHRPIKNNHGGQMSAQLFYSWYVAKKLQPAVILESGTFKGQETWAFEQT